MSSAPLLSTDNLSVIAGLVPAIHVFILVMIFGVDALEETGTLDLRLTAAATKIEFYVESFPGLARYYGANATGLTAS